MRFADDALQCGIGGGGLEGEGGGVIAVAGVVGLAQVEDDGGGHSVLIDEAARAGLVGVVMGGDVLGEVAQRMSAQCSAEAIAQGLVLLEAAQADSFRQHRHGGAAVDDDRLGGGDDGLGLDVLNGFFAQWHGVASLCGKWVLLGQTSRALTGASSRLNSCAVGSVWNSSRPLAVTYSGVSRVVSSRFLPRLVGCT